MLKIDKISRNSDYENYNDYKNSYELNVVIKFGVKADSKNSFD